MVKVYEYQSNPFLVKKGEFLALLHCSVKGKVRFASESGMSHEVDHEDVTMGIKDALDIQRETKKSRDTQVEKG